MPHADTDTGADVTARAAPMPTRTVYRKACRCRATATTATMRFSQEYNGARDALIYTLAFFPGPSCDKCGKPWVLDTAIRAAGEAGHA